MFLLRLNPIEPPQYCFLESHQAAAADNPTISFLPLRSEGDAAFLGIPIVAGPLY